MYSVDSLAYELDHMRYLEQLGNELAIARQTKEMDKYIITIWRFWDSGLRESEWWLFFSCATSWEIQTLKRVNIQWPVNYVAFIEDSALLEWFLQSDVDMTNWEQACAENGPNAAIVRKRAKEMGLCNDRF